MKELDLFTEHMKQKNLSENTVSSYMTDLKQFYEEVNKPIHEVNKTDIRTYLNRLRDSGMSSASIGRKLSAIKSFYKFCVLEDIIDTSPAQLLSSGKIEKKLPKTVGDFEISKILTNIDSLRDRAIIELLYATGIRRSELINLKRDDIYSHRNIIKVFGKGSKERLVPIHAKSLSTLNEWLSTHSSPWVFPSSKFEGQHISARRLNEIIKGYADKNGLTNITPHKFRHTLATNLYAAGADIKAIQSILGHSSIDTTNIYTRVNIDRETSEYQKLFAM